MTDFAGELAALLRDAPVIAQGQCCDLKESGPNIRIWICRCGAADGMAGDGVSVEGNYGGRWVVIRDGHKPRS